MITRKMDMQYNESRIITAILKVVATAELYDPDATEETIRYCVEQDLEDVGFDVSVELLKDQKAEGYWMQFDLREHATISAKCSCCGWEAHYYEDDVAGMSYCPNCGAKMKAVKWR